MDIKFRVANLEDVPAIIELCNICFNENTDLKKAQKIFLNNENDKNQIYIVGENNGEIVAHAKINILPTIYQQLATYAILNHICVKPTIRRKHIATQMLDYIAKICKKNKCVCMELWSRNFRKPAHKCYKKYGFKVVDAKFFTKEIL